MKTRWPLFWDNERILAMGTRHQGNNAINVSFEDGLYFVQTIYGSLSLVYDWVYHVFVFAQKIIKKSIPLRLQ